MGIGTGVALAVIGAILYFAVRVNPSGIDIPTVGLILMVTGIVVFVISLVLLLRGRRTVSVSQTDVDGRRTVRRDVDGDL